MTIKNRAVGYGVGAIIVLSFAACGKQPTTVTTSTPTLQSSGSASVTPALSNLEITSWGPNGTKAGVAFNVQPSGQAAIWVKMNLDLHGEASIVINGTKLKSAVTGNLITAVVPPDVYAKAGSYPLYVIDVRNGKEVKSNVVSFVVSAN